MKERVASENHVVMIAHYAPWLLNFRAPLLRALKSTGARLTVFLPGHHPEVRVQLLAMGIDVRTYPLRRTGLNPLQDMTTLVSLQRLLREVRPTHVLTTAVKPNIYGILAARIAGVPRSFALVTGLGYSFTGKSLKQQLISKLLSALYKLSFSRLDYAVFQNPDDAALFTKLGLISEDRVRLVAGSGVDLDDYQPVALTPADRIIFLMVARLVSEKGIREYIEAAKILKDRQINCEVLLVGPSDENPAAIKKAELDSLLAQGNVNYLGELRDVRSVLGASHVFVLPSYREGTPKSTLEAMATGRAVITTDAPGCRETVQENVNGLLVPVGDAGALADAMAQLAADFEKLESMGAASLRLVRQKFDSRLVNRAMLGIMGLEDKIS